MISQGDFLWKIISFNTDTKAFKLIRAHFIIKENDAIAYGETIIRYSDDNVIIYERKFF